MSGNPYTNSGPLDLTDLKGQLWRVESYAWIDTGITGCAFRLDHLPTPGRGLRPYARTRWDNDGRVHVESGYICDGSSVPLLGRYLDRRVSSWPGMVHDISYEGLRQGALDPSMRKVFDALYRDMLRAFGSYWITAAACYAGLRLFGGPSAARGHADYPRRLAP